MSTKSYRNRIRVYSFLSAAIVVASGFGIAGYYKAQKLQTTIEYNYQRSLEELGDYINNISIALEKGMYAGTPTQMSGVSAKIWRESGAAKSAMSQLPVTGLNLDNTYKFLSQAGDYTMSLAKKVVSQQQITDEEKNNLKALYDFSKKLNAQIAKMREDVAKGNFKIGEVKKAEKKEGEPSGEPSFGDGFKEAEDDFTGYPTLIYDGPFSDHIMQKKPEMLQNKKQVTKEQAKKMVAEKIKVDVSKIQDCEDENSKMPSYCFKTEFCNIAVTKQGGYISYIVNHRDVGESAISPEGALKYAQNYLKEMGIESLEKTYYEIYNGVMTINYAYKQNDIVVYPDLIKVGVALDNGEVVLFDTRGYLVNHKERKIETPKITKEQAMKSVSTNLTIKSSKMAVVPTNGLNEVLCYEFLGESKDGQKVLVYINAQSGVEEQILILIESENGVLTM